MNLIAIWWIFSRWRYLDFNFTLPSCWLWALAPVGVHLAVLGYAEDTYGGWLCGIIMQSVAPSVD